MEQKLLKLLEASRGTLEWPVVIPYGPEPIASHVIKTLRRLGISALVVAHQGRPYLVSGPHTTSFESWKLHCAITDAAANNAAATDAAANNAAATDAAANAVEATAVAPALILTQRYTLAVSAAIEAHKLLAAAAADVAAAADAADAANTTIVFGPVPLDEWARRTRAFESAATIALRLPA
jgi:hypothetical protein